MGWRRLIPCPGVTTTTHHFTAQPRISTIVLEKTWHFIMPFGILDPRLSKDDELLLPGTERLISDRHRLVAADHEMLPGGNEEAGQEQLKRVTYKVCCLLNVTQI